MIIIIFIGFMIFSGHTHALYIVDTGSPNGAGPSLSYGQYYAGYFRVSEKLLINSIEGWIQGNGVSTDNFTIALYNSSSGSPGINSGLPDLELYSSEFYPGSAVGATWRGIQNINWLLYPGNYWAAFEVRSPLTGNYAFRHGRLSNPLFAEAVYKVNINTWEPACETVQNKCIGPSTVQAGFRIGAVQVPEPESYLLLLLGCFIITKLKYKSIKTPNNTP